MAYLANWRISAHLDLDQARVAPVVLVAEDDPELRAFLAQALRRDGYDVLEARDGAAALEQLGLGRPAPVEPRTPDIVITDIRMPGMTGLEVLAGMRRADWATPVILITAFGDRHTLAEASRLGAAAVFYKPFDLDDLRTAVLNLVKPG